MIAVPHWLRTGLRAFVAVLIVCILAINGATTSHARTAVASAAFSALAQRAPQVELRVLKPWIGSSRRAYGLLSFEVENLRTDREQRIKVQCSSSDWTSSWSRTESYELQPGETRRLDWRLPAFAVSDGDVYLTAFDAAGESVSATARALGFVSNSNVQLLVVESGYRPAGWAESRAASLGAVTPRSKALDLNGLVTHSSGGGVSTGSLTIAIGQMAPTELPADADVLQGFDALIVDLASEAPSSAAQAALGVYLRRGGVLVLANGEAPRWQPPWLEQVLQERCRYLERKIPEPAWRVGLGVCLRSPGAVLADKDQLKSLGGLLDGFEAPCPPGTADYDNMRSVRTLPIAWLSPHTGMHPRTLSVLLFVLVLLLGPGTLWFVRSRGRAVLLLTAVPAAAFLATLGVLAFGLVVDGVGLKLSSQAYAVLDQGQQTISQHEARSYFAGPLVRGGLRPGAGSLVVPWVQNGLSSEPERGQTWILAEDPGLRLLGDFLPRRIERTLAVLSDRSTRLRLEVDFSGPTPRVANALGAPIESLTLVDFAGRSFGAPGPVAPGGSMDLVAIQDLPRERKNSTDWQRRLLVARGGAYFAVIEDRIAFDDLGQEKFEDLGGTTFLAGILAPEGAPANPEESR